MFLPLNPLVTGTATGYEQSNLENVRRLRERFASYGSLIDEGWEVPAGDVVGGVQAMRDAVDQVLRTGRPTYVISHFPFRPGGHANDQNPAPELMVLDQFQKTKQTLMSQFMVAATPSAAGGSSSSPALSTTADLAAFLESVDHSVHEQVETAVLNGNNILTRAEGQELSQPGVNTALSATNDPGQILSLQADYLLGKNQTQFAGMGSDIFGKAIDRQLTRADEENRNVRYVHQEAHANGAKAGRNDSRGGVYGELNAIQPKHLHKFVNFLPQEAQVVQVGWSSSSFLGT